MIKLVKKMRAKKLLNVALSISVFELVVAVLVVVSLYSVVSARSGPVQLVEDPVVSEPVIEKTVPAFGKMGDEFVIVGSGFSRNNKVIVEGKEIVGGVESREAGTEIVFELAGFESPCDPRVDCPVEVQVANENGVSGVMPVKLVEVGNWPVEVGE